VSVASSVIVTGTGFTGASAVDFGSTAATSFTVNSFTQLTAVSPAGGAGTVDVTVTTLSGTSAISAADQFTYEAAPTVSAVSPSGGPTGGGTRVTLTGTNLIGASAVDFGPSAATNFIVGSATQLTVTSPAGTVGTVDIIVISPAGTSTSSAADEFTYDLVPTVSAVSPLSGPLAEGTTVTLTGTGFSGVEGVSFGSDSATNYIVNSATQLTAIAPAEPAGLVEVTVTTAAGTSPTSPADEFAYQGMPSISSLSPAAGPPAGGTSVTISGTGFIGTSAVDFGSAPAGYIVNSAHQIVARSPGGAAGDVEVTITTPSGTSASTADDLFTYETVSVTNPGNQTSPSNAAITTLGTVANDTQSGATLAYAATGLPTGLSMAPGTGAITGTPSAMGTYTVTVTATDGSGLSGSASFTWTITAAIITDTISVTNPGARTSASGNAITALDIVATDSAPGATLAYAATGLPAGLSIGAGTGAITGAPTTAGVFPITVTVTDSSAFAGSASFTWTVTGAVAVANPGSQSSPSGSAITARASTATDSSAGTTITWSALGLPTGLSISSAGLITGTPTTTGTYSVTVTATDNFGAMGAADFTWAITGNVAVANPGNKSSISGTAISALANTATDTQAGAGFTWAATGLPTGLSITPATGAITGTPTVAGTYTVNVTATDGSGYSGSASFTWTIVGAVALTSPGDQSSFIGSAITALALVAHDTQAGASFTWAAAGLPAGLSMSSAGTITGTPRATGDYTVSVIATDGSGDAGSASFNWSVGSAITTEAVSVTNPGNQSDVLGPAITALDLTAVDSQTGATFTWSASGLPAGLSVNWATGDITGTPSAAGTYTVSVTATDASGLSGPASFTWAITSPAGANTVSVTNPGPQSSPTGMAITALDNAATDSSPSATIASWSASGLPVGLSILTATAGTITGTAGTITGTAGTAGTITGTPTTAGTYLVGLSATDSSGAIGAANFTWTVTGPVSVTNLGARSDASGTAINPMAATATDADATIASWSATGLPAGLSIDAATGLVTGTPTTPGPYSVTLTATDSSGAMGAASFNWAITSELPGPAPSPSPSPSPSPQSSTVSVANPGNQSDFSGPAIPALLITATDSWTGAKVLTWSATGLPTGLSIATSTGSISGMPTTTGVYAVTVTATDEAGFAGSASFTWTITSTVTVTNPGARSNLLGLAIVPLASTATGTASGTAVTWFTWSATGLPSGLSVNAATGTITGTPDLAGAYTVALTATDSSGSTGTAGFAWTITRAAGLFVATISLAPGEARTAYSQTLAASGGAAPYSWSVTTGSLPGGLSLKAVTGTISGRLAPGAKTTTFAVTVTDSSGQTASRSYTITVIAASVRTAMMAALPDGKGYWLASTDGAVRSFGAAVLYGSMSDRRLADPVVGIISTPDGLGYWLVASDGGVFNFGDAHFYGSTGGDHLTGPIVAMVSTADAKGYWLVSSVGQVFSFGDARSYAAKAAPRSPRPIVGMVATADAKGYWLVASGGAVFSFGDAHFYGSAGNSASAQSIVGVVATADGKGYWLVASNGHVLGFGDAHLYGSATNMHLARPIVGMVATADGKGYWLVANDGGIFTYGDATFYGSEA
jgi:hypothetical protein